MVQGRERLQIVEELIEVKAGFRERNFCRDKRSVHDERWLTDDEKG